MMRKSKDSYQNRGYENNDFFFILECVKWDISFMGFLIY